MPSIHVKISIVDDDNQSSANFSQFRKFSSNRDSPATELRKLLDKAEQEASRHLCHQDVTTDPQEIADWLFASPAGRSRLCTFQVAQASVGRTL